MSSVTNAEWARLHAKRAIVIGDPIAIRRAALARRSYADPIERTIGTQAIGALASRPALTVVGGALALALGFVIGRRWKQSSTPTGK